MVITIGVVAALLILGVVKDLVIKIAVESGTQMVTGLKLRMGTFRVGMLNTLVDIRNLSILNPAGFEDRNMLDMPEIFVDYDLPAVFKGKVRLTEARINLKEFTVVKNAKGELNIDSLKVVQAQKSGAKPAEKGAVKTPEIQIDKLRLTIGKAVYKDYSAGPTPRVMEFNVNIDEEYKNITDPYALVSLIVVKSLTGTSIANLTNFDLKGLSNSVSGTLASAQKAAAQATEKVKETTKAAVEAAKKTQASVAKTTDALKGAFKNPFGSK